MKYLLSVALLAVLVSTASAWPYRQRVVVARQRVVVQQVVVAQPVVVAQQFAVPVYQQQFAVQQLGYQPALQVVAPISAPGCAAFFAR